MGVNLHRMSSLSVYVRIRHVLLLVILTRDLGARALAPLLGTSKAFTYELSICRFKHGDVQAEP